MRIPMLRLSNGIPNKEKKKFKKKIGLLSCRAKSVEVSGFSCEAMCFISTAQQKYIYIYIWYHFSGKDGWPKSDRPENIKLESIFVKLSQKIYDRYYYYTLFGVKFQKNPHSGGQILAK